MSKQTDLATLFTKRRFCWKTFEILSVNKIKSVTSLSNLKTLINTYSDASRNRRKNYQGA